MSRIDLAQAGPAAHENRRLEDRDVVMVLPEEKRIIHVTGLVRKPDQFAVPQNEDIHVLDAIAMAGGTTSPVADKVYVIRQLGEMPEPVVIKVSIAGAKRNGNENLRLAAGDLVSVESTVSTLMLESVSKFFRMAIGVNGSLTAL
jgi:polysaccharide export outer membrane protein